jgi:hypothetical protein
LANHLGQIEKEKNREIAARLSCTDTVKVLFSRHRSLSKYDLPDPSGEHPRLLSGIDLSWPL